MQETVTKRGAKCDVDWMYPILSFRVRETSVPQYSLRIDKLTSKFSITQRSEILPFEEEDDVACTAAVSFSLVLTASVVAASLSVLIVPSGNIIFP